jgi:predicted nuclease of restriction endonuclease-like (RecB) superfamily
MIKKISSKKENAKELVGMIPKDYAEFLKQIKTKIKKSQIKAALAVNSELIQLYWDIGKDITEKLEKESWKSQVIERLCRDIQNDFPGIEGFSRTNVFRMKSFYQAYSRIPQAVGFLSDLPIIRIPWGHNILLIERVKNVQERLWYANQVIEEGLSRSALEDSIMSKTYKRQGKALTNFSNKLPAPQSELAQETLKNPYCFDFLRLTKGYKEKELEQGLIDEIQKFILALGKGFAFIGRQYAIEIAGDTCYLDLLFYHTTLHCYCIIELKTTAFQPEFAGKMNYYISAVDRIDLFRNLYKL